MRISSIKIAKGYWSVYPTSAPGPCFQFQFLVHFVSLNLLFWIFHVLCYVCLFSLSSCYTWIMFLFYYTLNSGSLKFPFWLRYFSTSPYKIQTQPNAEVVHGLEKPTKEIKLFPSTYAIFLSKNKPFCI